MEGQLNRVSTIAAFARSQIANLFLGDDARVGSDSRAWDRQRRIVLTAFSNGTARAISIATLFISIPLTLHYLGSERYGLWLTISSVASLLSFMDFGIGNGLLNAVASAYGRGDIIAIRRDSSSAMALLGLTATLFAIAFLCLQGLVDWGALFNVHTQIARAEARSGISTLVVIFALSIPVSLIQRMQLALQKGFMASIWQCAASLFGLAGILVAIRLHAGISWLLISFFGAPLLMSVFNGFVFFGFLEPQLAPAIAHVRRDALKQVSAIGSGFFALQIIAPLLFGFDALIIARFIGPASVPQYAVPERMFSVFSIMLSFVLTPLWPAYTEALSRGDLGWVRATLARSIRWSIIGAAVWSLFLLLFGNVLLGFWVGRSIRLTLILSLGLALWKVLESWGGALASFLNACGIIRLQIWCGLATVILATVLKLMLVQRIGVAGIVWGTLLASAIGIVMPFAFFARSEMTRRLELKLDS